MANEYYEHSAFRIPSGTKANASDVNNIADEIELGFNKLPALVDLKAGTSSFAGDDTGIANAYVAVSKYPQTGYVDGQQILFRPAFANTGASTLNLDTLGAKSIVRQDGSPLEAGDIPAGAVLVVTYNGTADRFEILGNYNEAVTAAAAAIAAQGLAETAQGLAEDAQSAAELAQAAAESSASSAEAWYNTFTGTYYGASASDPALDPNGDAPTEGDMYYNTTLNRMRVFDGTQWQDAVAAVVGSAGVDEFIATAGQTDFVGTHSAQVVNVYLNGVLLPESDYTWTQSTLTVVLNTGASLNDNVTILAVTSVTDFDERYLGPYASAPAAKPDGSPLTEGVLYWDTVFNLLKVYDGAVWIDATSAATISEHTFSGDGSTVAFDTGRTVLDDVLALVWIGGVMQSTSAFGFSGTSTCTFTSAPPAGADNIVIRIYSAIDGLPAFATQAEAEAGTSSTVMMSPENVSQFMGAFRGRRNALTNGNFRIWQRGTSAVTGGGASHQFLP